MATIDAITHQGPQAWSFEWSGTPPYDVWNTGELLLEQTTDTSLIVQNDDDEEPPPLEVRDAADTEDAQNIQWPPRIDMQWRSYEPESIDHYLLEEYTGGEWVIRYFVSESSLGYYRQMTAALADMTQHLWRLTAVDAAGVSGAVRPYTIDHVRNPDPPRITSTYTKPNLVISARA